MGRFLPDLAPASCGGFFVPDHLTDASEYATYHVDSVEEVSVKLEVKIDDHVPMPGKRKVKIEYPWSSMGPGTSFFTPLPADTGEARKFKQLLYKKAIRHWGSGNYYARQVNEGGIDGVRIWRKNDQDNGGPHDIQPDSA